jgi:subtilase family serine protease
MLRRTPLSMFVITFVAFALALPLFTFAQTGGHSRALITQRIDEAKLVTLEGNTHPEANSANDRGIVADDLQLDHMILQLRRPAEQQQALDKYVNDLTDLHSPSYHQWLTAKDFGEKYGLAASDLSSITGWLESNGFTVNGVYASNILIDFSGTAGQVRRAFHTEIHNLDVDGVKHIANMSDPKIPAALAEAVVGVISLHDFMPHPMYKPKTNYTLGGGEFAIVPADLATIYNLNPLFTAGTTGLGQTVVVIEDTNVFKTTDWNTFRTTFGLSTFTSGSFTQVHPTGTATCTNPGTNGDEIEAILDAEYASAAAPNAAIELASCSGTATTFGGLIAVNNLINSATPPPIMSVSYGFCEAFNGATANAGFNSAYEQAASEGVSVFVSAGDEGAASCDANESKSTHGIGVTGWGETPFNVAVGGTDFGDSFAKTTGTYWNSTNTATFGSAKSYVPEIPWNDSCASVLITTFNGSTVPYGSTGFCNTTLGKEDLSTASGSGGPSGCATGKPTVSGVVGGSCAGYAKPSWQTGVIGIPSDGVRDIPDVSLFAANGAWGHFFLFCDSDGGGCTGTPNNWDGAGGTSFSSPILAGIQALVNEKTGSTQGNPNPTYYSLAATEYGATGNAACNSTLGNGVASTCVFYDVTQGDMDVNCTGLNNCYDPSGTNGVLSTSNTAYQPAYTTGTGWDFATGLGTVNAFNLVNAWPVTTSPSFTLSAAPNSLSIAQGANGTSTITITPKNGFTGSVSLAASGLPSGVTASFNPQSATSSSVLTLTASATAATGTVTVTVTGTSGSLTATTTISLTVTSTSSANFTLKASPTSLTIAKGASGRSMITVTPTGGFTGSVSFSASGLPTGVTATFTPTSSTTGTRLALTVGTSAASGTSTITITGTSGSLTNTTTVSLTVSGGSGGGSFTLSAAPASVTLTPGGASGTSTITVTPSGGFTGSVTFTTSALPSGVTASFNPTSSTTSSVLTLTASSTATAGKTAVTITGTSGSTTATVQLKLAVQ